jgi:serine/threonine-protein kinase
MNYIGQKLDDRYLVKKLIGEGGMADVYSGKDLTNGMPIAIKILKHEYAKTGDIVRRFINESRAISVLRHPNIVKVFDIGASAGLNYIVMELIHGITLKEYIDQRGEPLTYKEVVHFLSNILRALGHAHDKGIVHRDIKPQNIMILEDGDMRIMDFGIARLARSEIHTDADQAIGSVHYISPEQAQGIETDMRADIYSLGIMLYEMLSGKLPFDADDAVAVAIKQISDEAKPLYLVNRSVPMGLCDITMKAMEKNPAKRYQNALEMLRDVEEFKHNPSRRFIGDVNEVRTINKANMPENPSKKNKKAKKYRNKKLIAKIAGAIKKKTEIPWKISCSTFLRCQASNSDNCC